VAALGPYLETEPTDAEIVIDEAAETVTIVPSIPALAPDPATLIDSVWAALDSPDRTGQMTYAQGREADFSTADAEALGIKGVLGKFTTNHACCQARVTNIQLIAEAVDGAMVMPGETFSLNDWVGQRTEAKAEKTFAGLTRKHVEHLECRRP
jgi:vancomycin resistance protein YoaR